MRIQSQLDSFLRGFGEIQRSLGLIQRVLAKVGQMINLRNIHLVVS